MPLKANKTTGLLKLLCAAVATLCVTVQSVGAQDIRPVMPGKNSFKLTTLDTVKARGYLICASTKPMAGFAQVSAEGLWSGFDVDICRALAAGIFGDPSKVEFRPLSGETRFAYLTMGDVDVIVRNSAWTMSRDTDYDATYVGPAFYDGLAFMVSNRISVVSAYELDDIKICATSDSEDLGLVRDFFFKGQVNYDEVLYEDREDLAVAYRSGACDAIAESASWLFSIRKNLPEPVTHRILPERLSKTPYGPVVRSNDPQWKSLIVATLNTLVNAEELGITSVNIQSMAATRRPVIRKILGLEPSQNQPNGLSVTWMRDVISAVGNYGEIYERHFGSGASIGLMRGQNALWSNGGLIYAPPIY